MKFILDETLFLETIASVKANYPTIPDDQFMSIISLDPTYIEGRDSVGRYGKWLLNLYNKGNLCNFGHVNDVLTRFEDNKKFLKNKDIGQFKSIEAIDDYLNNPDNYNEESARQKVRDAQKARRNADLGKEAELVIDGSKWKVWIPKTYAASCKLGQDTSWCTATTESDHYYNYYSKQGPLYIIINNSDTNLKYQFHFESEQFMDSEDYSMVNPYQFVQGEPDLVGFFEPKFAELVGIDLSVPVIEWTISHEKLAEQFEDIYHANTNHVRDAVSGEFIAAVLTGDCYHYFEGDDSTDYLPINDLSDSVREELDRLDITIDDLVDILNEESDLEIADAVMEALQQAAFDGSLTGSIDAAYNDIVKAILDANTSENLFEVTRGPDGFIFSVNTANALYTAYDDEYREFFTDYSNNTLDNLMRLWFYCFELFEPYYGWNDFSKEAFNDRLADELYAIGDR